MIVPSTALALVVFCAHFLEVLPDEQASPEQLEILRRIPGERRLRLAEQLYWSARKMKIAGLRAQHPNWSTNELEAEARRIFAHART